MRKPLLLLMLSSVVLAQPPAAASDRDGRPRPERDVLQRQVEQGPVRLLLQLAPPRPALSDRLQLTLTLKTRAGVEVFPPEFAERLGDFRILEQHAERPHLGLEEDRYRYRLVLEPLRSGPCRILPIAVNFRDPRQGPGAERQTVESPALTISIHSRVDAENARLDEAARWDGPLAAPSSYWPAIAGAGVAGVLVSVAGAALAAVWILRRRPGSAAEPEVSPAEAALRDLERLRQEDGARRDVKVFFVRLTEIVRKFLERTTGVLAVEQTTEEFLREIGTSPRFSAGERARLKEFLESADVVKFAGHRPPPEDMERAFAAAREVVTGSLVEEQTS